MKRRAFLSLLVAFLLSLQVSGASPVAVRLYPSGFILSNSTEVRVTAIIEPDTTNRWLDIFVINDGEAAQHSQIDLAANPGRKSFLKQYRLGSGKYIAEAVLSRLIEGKWETFRAVSQPLFVCGMEMACTSDPKVRESE